MSAKDATVIATYSRRMRLRLDDGVEVDARIKGKKLKPVCGDTVVAEPIAGEQDWLITAIHPRRNALTRPNMRGHTETLAANLDLVVVVAAISPKPDWFVVDRYLCAAENMGASAAVVFNKTDLADTRNAAAVVDVYRALGYPCISCSAETGENLQLLEEILTGQTAIVVGQSGVGKSSLINRMSGDAGQKTATVSEKTGEGRHTTVNSVMTTLANGGVVIDSPGVRDYAPALTTKAEVISGFREVRDAGEHCRFANCQHLREPNCAVKEAAEEGRIDARRYESYRRSLALVERLTQGRH